MIKDNIQEPEEPEYANNFEVHNNLNANKMEIVQTRANIKPKETIKQKLQKWYSSLKEESGEEQVKQNVKNFIKNSVCFIGSIFVIEACAKFIDNLK